jgi:hypothetical protein
MRRKGSCLLLLVLLLWGVALAGPSPVPAGCDEPLAGEDEIYPLSLLYREQVDEEIGLAQMPAVVGLALRFPTCGVPACLEEAPPARPTGANLFYTLMSLRW